MEGSHFSPLADLLTFESLDPARSIRNDLRR